MLAGLLLLVSISTSGAQIDYAQLFGLGNGVPVFGPDPRAPDPSAFYRSQDTSSVGKAVARGLPININSVIHNVKSAPASAHLELWDQASPSPTAAPAPQPAPVPQLFPVRRQRHWPRYDHYGGDPYYHPYFDEGGYESYEPPPRRPPRPRPRRPGRPSTSRYTRPEDVASISETGRETAKHKVDKGEGTNLNMVGGGNTEADKNEGTKTSDSGDVKGDLKKLSGDLGSKDHSDDKKKKPTDEGTKEKNKDEENEKESKKTTKDKEDDDSSEGKKKKSKTKQRKEEDDNEKDTDEDEDEKGDKEKASGLKKGEVPLDQAGVHGLADKSKTSNKKGGKKEKGKKKGGDEEEGGEEDENGPLEVVDGEVKVPKTVDGDTEGGEEDEDEEAKGKKMKKKGGKKAKKGKKKNKKKNKKDEEEEEGEEENEDDEREDGEEEDDEQKEKDEEDEGEEDGGEENDDECAPMSPTAGMMQHGAKPHAPSTTTPAGDDYSDFESSDCEEEDEKEEVETKKKKKGGKNKKQKKGKKGKKEKKKKGGVSKKGKKTKCPMQKKPKCGGKKKDDNGRHEDFGGSNDLNPNPSPAFVSLNQYPVSQSSGSYPVAPGYGRQYDAPKQLKGLCRTAHVECTCTDFSRREKY